MLAAPEQRALARDAVRQSLVLLKNNGGLLPLASNKHVLVAGDGADNIGKQSGGWTITWQGTGLKNADFPGGTSVWGGVKAAVKAGGGSAELSTDGNFKKKPDYAIVVFGENPYAEFQGDLKVLTLPGSMTQHLDIMKKLQDEKIPVVAVLLSGRPLWQNRELNLANAYVAAWLPGTEGGGISDVLFRKKDGAVNYDFTGKLSFSWPRDATGTPLNVGKEPYDPLFPLGLWPDVRGSRRTSRHCPEDPGIPAELMSTGSFFDKGQAGAALVAAGLQRGRHHAHHHRAGRNGRWPRQGHGRGRHRAGRRAPLRVRRQRQRRGPDHQRRRRRSVARSQWRRDVVSPAAPRGGCSERREARHGLRRRMRRFTTVRRLRWPPCPRASGRPSVCRSSASRKPAST